MTERGGLPPARRAIAMLALSLGTMLSVIDGAIPNVALPTIARDLGIDGSAAVLVVTVYQLVLVMALLPLSAIGDRIGHKRLYQGGQALFTVATILCFFARSLPFLLVVRALQALGAAGALAVVSVMLRTIFPPDRLGRALGLNAVVIAVSGAIAPAVGGAILGVLSWPWVFAVGAPFGILSLAIGRFALPDVAGRSGRFDGTGALLNIGAFGLGVAGLEALVHGAAPAIGLTVAAIGVGLGVALVRHERRESAPILPVDLLAMPMLGLSILGAFLAFVAQMLLMLSLPFRLAHGYGLRPGEIGAMLSPWPLATMVVSPVAGVLSDRIPAGLLGLVGMGIATAALLLLAWLPPHPLYADVAWRMALSGAGFGLFLSPNARIVVGSAPKLRVAAAGSLLSTGRLVGQTIGATAAATLLALNLGTGPAAAIVAAALAMLAGLASAARLRAG